jgi:hypothetical protein
VILKQKLDISELVELVQNNKEYMDFVISTLEKKVTILQNEVIEDNKRIDTFRWPTREERCAKVPYR